MELLNALLTSDPAAPRLTVYNETTGARLDFSATTLDNWAAKVGNMLVEEFDCEPGCRIAVDLPAGWQPVVIVLGALAAGIDWTIGIPDDVPEVVFTSPDRITDDLVEGSDCDIALVTDDPMGRGVVETGGEVPDGLVDFGPTVRVYGDIYPAPTPRLDTLYPAGPDTPRSTPARVMSTGFTDTASLISTVLEPLAAGGSAVIVTGPTGADRLETIAAEENVTQILR
ncbi:TIGR03089 family protein [Corynebacterium mendelii]|uniref:TIGR03089 family protein n=1 Tax=Corynebacterium mendelii TaxID=2765362 RepID=A0A939E117_9CORY|nr:TIGR03089 family protein [Corynebacterium mendelii]MBN9644486.1 TIGR03089 family protein [Corynebacterium mendelii]